ncbi:MFS transporter [Massilia sp. S19_KUP03_FR1]|uniref:MFS transporter n=1 Tax=Massilia sp. S19_KUP03_FR1 TaxID=3025503 RepID=UPI002FCD8D32
MFYALHRAFIDRLGRDRLLQLPDFRRFWGSTILTSFGGQITLLALPLCAVLLLHASPAQMGLLVALEGLPYLLFSLPAGVLLDRSRRLPIMIASDIMLATALASVPVAWWLGMLSIHWLYAVGFVMGTGAVVGGSAEQIFLTFLVGRDGLVQARAKFGTTDAASRLLGPGMAGVLIQLLGAPIAILFNTSAFVVSLWNLTRIGAREPAPVFTQAHPVRAIVEGLRFISRHPLLRTLAWTAGAWNLLFSGYVALQVVFATRVLGMSPGVLGTAQMLGGLGMLAGSLAMMPLSKRFGSGAIILIGLCGTVVAFALLPCITAQAGTGTTTALAYGAVTFFLDMGALLFFMPYISLRQRVTPDALLGRMTSTMRFLGVAGGPAGALLAGAMAERYGVRAALGGVAAGGVMLALVMVFGTQLRHVKD